MKPVLEILEQRISETLQQVSGLENCPAIVRPAADTRFGDYQANGIMPAAKQLKINPRQLAEKVVAELNISDICQTPEIAGPGFINLCLKTEFIEKRLLQIFADVARLGIDKTERPQTVVVDYSGPNIAKEMHVGHLRSTIIGDAIAQILEFQGHNVIRQNHIGDWGLQMGMIINALIEKEFGSDCINFANQKSLIKAYHDLEKNSDNYPEFQKHFRIKFNNALQLHLDTLERAYKIEAEKIKTNEEAAKAAKQRTFDLQNGDSVAKVFWEEARRITLEACFSIYQEIGVTFKEEDIRGESFYNDKLPVVVKELKDKGLAVESEGATCVFPEGFKTREGEPLPFIIQKTDGAYLYATTDLAAIRFRLKELGAKRIIYVTDARQSLHFKMLFAVAKMAGWIDEKISLEHVMFGAVLGENGKPLKTRSGENVKLKELLDEAVKRARAVADEKNPDLPEQQKQEIAQAVGIGAVKYADYSNNRDSDYIFSFDKMLSLEGNTAPYMQYAYARIKSIERKAVKKELDIESELANIQSIHLDDPAEIELAKMLVRYDQAVENAAAGCRPNFLTAYLYDLTQVFSRFYNACPVLQSEGQTRTTRLLLCDMTARTIRHGMTELLGIEVPEQM